MQVPSWLVGHSIAGNAVWRWLLFLALILIAAAIGQIVKIVAERVADRRFGGKDSWGGVLLRAVSRTWVLVSTAIGFHAARAVLVLDAVPSSMADSIGAILNAAAAGYAFYCLCDLSDFFLMRLASRTESKVDDVLVPLVGRSVRIIIGMIVILNVVQEVSGKNITTILASLGVGGLAVALAGQDTIKNFFGSLVILGDRPFEVGDRIVVDGHDGPVEAVGFRSTKIRTLEGALVTVPNAEMVSRSVCNMGKREYIRRTMTITITYDTSPAKVRRALDILRDILKDHEGMKEDRPPRVFFGDFGDWALKLNVIYWYHPADYFLYMAFSEGVNFRVLERFNEEGISFAFPSQTVYMSGAAVDEMSAG